MIKNVKNKWNCENAAKWIARFSWYKGKVSSWDNTKPAEKTFFTVVPKQQTVKSQYYYIRKS